MPTRILLAALAVTAAAPALAGAAELDPKRYMPVSEVRSGMTGVGRTTLKGAEIVEFKAEVLAVLERYGPKQALIVCRLSGAGLEESGVIAGMSGSPVYIDGRLIGAVAYAYTWCKLPIAGVQPIEQMLGAEERFRRRPDETQLAADRPTRPGPVPIPVPATALGEVRPPADVPEHEAYRMVPIRTPVMVGGMPRQVIDRLADDLAPYGLVPMAAGGAEHDLPVAAKLEPGAPLAVAMLRGDIQMTVMGTITEVVGDRVYAFGHAMYGMGEANYPMLTGVAKVVIPSRMRSFRMGAPVKEIGRLVWDEETAVLGQVGKERAPMTPITVKVTGPGKGMERSYECEMMHSRDMSALLAATAASAGLIAHSEPPLDHTVRYRVRVKPEGREPLVRENLAVSPNADSYVAAVVRHLVDNVVENPFENLKVESVEVEAAVEAGRRFAEIEKSRALRNRVRPGGTVPVELKIRPWREAPRWITVEVPIPEEYPEGTYDLVLCGGDEALRLEQREVPARFKPDDLASMLQVIAMEKPRDRLYVRLERPGRGIAVGRDELPNLPPSMRTVLTTSARRDVTPVNESRVTSQPMEWVLEGGRQLKIAVDREAPEH
jgi:hypothetical protein